MRMSPIMRSLQTITLVIVASHSCYSQQVSSKSYQFNFGLTAGINFSTLRVQHNSAGANTTVSKPEAETQIGYQIGVPFKVTRNQFFISGSLLFVNNNTQVINQDDFNSMLYKTENDFQWLKIPLNFNYIFLQKSTHRFFVGLGATTGKLLNATTQVSADFGTTTISGNKINTNETFRKWSVFGAAQVGGDLLIASSIPITITLSYDHNLNNLMDELPNNPNMSFDYGFVQPKARMTSAALSISYFIK